MYGLAYVLIRPDFTSLQDELDRTLAAFKRGGEDDFPLDKLAFDDLTSWMKRVWREPLAVERSRSGLRIHGDDNHSSYLLETTAVHRFLEEQGVDRWEGRLSDVEPDFTNFGLRFCKAPLDGRTGRFGRWLNPLGMWDWWELGGRFDGFVTGQPREASDFSTINSGPSAGRAMLTRIGEALSEALDAEIPDTTAEIEANVELATTVLDHLNADAEPRWPTAVVRPFESTADAARWVDDEFFSANPPEVRAALDLPPTTDSSEVKRAALERHRDCVVAGVAYHC